MSAALPIEAVEPDPAATSLPNDATMNKENGDASAPTVTKAAADETEVENKEENGAVANTADANDEKDTEVAEKESQSKSNKRLRTYENGVLKTSAQVIEGENNSRYDASILPESEDASKARAQVIFLGFLIATMTDR
jgi:lupus La protein